MPRSKVSLFGWVIAIAFIAGTLLTYVDRLNLFATPPNVPDTANMVDRTIANAQYREAIWPVFLWTNLAFAIGFAAAVVFAWVIAARARVAGGMPVFKALAAVGGTISAIAAVMSIGSVNSAVWQLYCDCGFKEQEIISGIWAGTVMQDTSDWLSRFAGIVLAIGLVALVREGSVLLSPLLRTWTYISALVIALVAILPAIGGQVPIPETLVELLQTAAGLILIPVWAVWLARRVDASGAALGAAPA